MSYYAEVILPLPLENTFTYRIPEGLVQSVVPYARVVVPFGKAHFYTAIVKSVGEMHDDHPAYTLKELVSLLPPTPFVLPQQVTFWEWVASYYLCRLGDVFHAAVPASLKLESQTMVSLCDTSDTSEIRSDREQHIVHLLADNGRLTIKELAKKTGERQLLLPLTQMVERGIIAVSEELKRGFTPRTETFLTLTDEYLHDEALHGLLEQLKRAKQQTKLLVTYLDATTTMIQTDDHAALSKKELLAKSGVHPSILRSMVQRGIFRLYEKERELEDKIMEGDHSTPPLTYTQRMAFEAIQTTWLSQPVCLLAGDAGGGRTAVYIHLIQEILNEGRQVLLLLPEIILAAPLATQLSAFFGDQLRIYHSGIPERTRVELWFELLRSTKPMVVLGMRSALFLPFSRLGLVIVDEEQEPSYKQQQPAPRYHARNAAVMLAHMHGAKTVLGSSTPSIESYYNVVRAKYGMVTLAEPTAGDGAPRIYLVNTKELRRKKIMTKGLFSPLLRESMRDALAAGERIILFQNKRGFASLMECQACGYVPRCTRCDLTLTYHKHNHRLVCHYCGFSTPLLVRCPSCQGEEIKLLGFGTEKVEEEVRTIFPEARVARVDYDTARTRKGYEQLIRRFEEGETDILVGTQMIAKGLNFEQVGVVGVVHADGLMNYPDFRSYERAFQLLMQVSGHAGGTKKGGVVVIQTSDPEQPILRMVKEGDYEAMAVSQLHERQQYRYPPYCRLIMVHLSGRDVALLRTLAAEYARLLSQMLGVEVLGPIDPPVNKVHLYFLTQLVIKVDSSKTVEFVRTAINKAYKQMLRLPAFKQIRIHYDVD